VNYFTKVHAPGRMNPAAASLIASPMMKGSKPLRLHEECQGKSSTRPHRRDKLQLTGQESQQRAGNAPVQGRGAANRPTKPAATTTRIKYPPVGPSK